MCLLEMLQRWQIPGELEATRPDNNLFVCVYVYTVALTVSVKQQQQHSLSGSPDSTSHHFCLETLQPADQRVWFRNVSRWNQSDLSSPNCCLSQFCRLLSMAAENDSGWILSRRTRKTSSSKPSCSRSVALIRRFHQEFSSTHLTKTCCCETYAAAAAEPVPKRFHAAAAASHCVALLC